MKTFMAVYTGEPKAFEQWQNAHPDPKQRETMEKTIRDANIVLTS